MLRITSLVTILAVTTCNVLKYLQELAGTTTSWLLLVWVIVWRGPGRVRDWLRLADEIASRRERRRAGTNSGTNVSATETDSEQLSRL